MSNDFKALVDFLEQFEPEVSGRSVPVPEDEAAAKLERFASGSCSQQERAEVCEMLRLHPAWLRWLADRVRLARSQESSPR